MASFAYNIHHFWLTSEIFCVSLEFDHSQYCDLLYQQFAVTPSPNHAQAVPSRRAEFLAGRIAAKLCLAQFGMQEYQVLVGQHRNPIWPDTYLGSISHCGNRAMCAIMPMTDSNYLGLDIEKWISPSVESDIGQTVITNREQVILEQLNLPKQQSVTLAFSLKESIFKALYPLVGEYFGFEAAQIVKISGGSADVVLTQTLSKHCKAGLNITVHFRYNHWGVLTFTHSHSQIQPLPTNTNPLYQHQQTEIKAWF